MGAAHLHVLSRDGLPSVAGRQLADDYVAEALARVTAGEALEWARTNKVDLPEKGRVAAINAARVALHLPPFVIMGKREGPEEHAPIPRMVTVSKQEPVMAVVEPPKTDRATIMKRTSAGLRAVLFDELDDLRAGRSDPKKALAVAALAKTIVDSVRMELDFIKHTDGKLPDGLPTIDLVKA